jgi:hypothetical protein
LSALTPSALRSCLFVGTDPVSAAQTLYIDGVLKAKASGGSLAYSWNTRKMKSGTHTLQAVARDAAGNSSTASVQVTTR